MTEDFARDMQLLKDLLKLASDQGHSADAAYKLLDTFRADIETRAGGVMTAVQDMKKAFNETNRELLMGFWIAIFIDPVDPAFEKPLLGVEPALTEAELLKRAHEAGKQLIALLDALKTPHRAMGDLQPQGGTLTGQITGVRALVPGDLAGGHAWLSRRLDAMIRAFTKDGGGGGADTYWPSNYVSSSSSSSSSSSYP